MKSSIMTHVVIQKYLNYVVVHHLLLCRDTVTSNTLVPEYICKILARDMVLFAISTMKRGVLSKRLVLSSKVFLISPIVD